MKHLYKKEMYTDWMNSVKHSVQKQNNTIREGIDYDASFSQHKIFDHLKEIFSDEEFVSEKIIDDFYKVDMFMPARNLIIEV